MVEVVLVDDDDEDMSVETLLSVGEELEEDRDVPKIDAVLAVDVEEDIDANVTVLLPVDEELDED